MQTLTASSTLQDVRTAAEEFPAENWIDDYFTHPDNFCNHCFLGFTNLLVNKKHFRCGVISKAADSALDEPIRKASSSFLKIICPDIHEGHDDITTVNNGKYGPYQQETPRGRVLACLDDMIAAGVQL